VVNRFEQTGLAARCTPLSPRAATDEEVLRAHSAAHLASLDALFEPEGEAVQTRGDLFWNAHTASAARTSAGCAVTAALSVCSGATDAAFAVIRPPGHHAECDRAMGFCFLNNASIAALAALASPHDIRRVLILDWDVHHGNGIEAIHYEDPRILYVSIHRHSTDPATWFYPGTGAVGDVGEGDGVGFNVNVPWPERGGGDPDYLAAFDHVIGPIARDFDPCLVLISAGFDAAEGDPLGQMCVSPGGYHAMARRCVSYARTRRCVALLEGGYNLKATADAAEATLRGLLGEEEPARGGGRREQRCKRVTETVLRAVMHAQAPHWPVVGTKEARAALDAHFASLHLAAASLGASPAPPARKKETKEEKDAAAPA
jgi:acetoin utilization deacetylase AcuC-like enzyme